MVIHTIHDRNTSSPASSSTPLPSGRTTGAPRPQRWRFSVADAVHLKRRLQALDSVVSNIRPGQYNEANIAKIKDACSTPRPCEETVYVPGSEEFYLVVKRFPVPHKIAHVYAQAYKDVLQGKPYLNHKPWLKQNFLPGSLRRQSIFSEVRPVLGDIDRLLDTNLEGAFATLEDRVQPFPFLRLPAELRLHVYSQLLPLERRIVLIPPSHAFPPSRLNIMRANRQIHHEVSDYFYKNWRPCVPVHTLVMLAHPRRPDDIVSFQKNIAAINPANLELLKELEIHVTEEDYSTIRTPRLLPLSYIFDILKVERVHITFKLYESVRAWRQDTDRKPFGLWLLDQIPASVHVSWSHKDAAAFFRSTAVEQRFYQALQERPSTKTAQNVALVGHVIT